MTTSVDGSSTAMPHEGPSRVDGLLQRARAGLDRVHPEDLAEEVSRGAVVIDIRPVVQRARDGEVPGAVVIDRNVLEWRLDPTSPHRIPIATAADVRYVLVCHEGYSSSLAAATLRELGLLRATDLVGGFRAWAARRPLPAGREDAVDRGSGRVTVGPERVPVPPAREAP